MEVGVPLAVPVEIGGNVHQTRRQELELEELVVVLVKTEQEGKTVFRSDLSFKRHDLVVEATAHPFRGFPTMEMVEDREFRFSVHADQICQFRSNPIDGCRRAGRSPAQRLGPRHEVDPHPRVAGASLHRPCGLVEPNCSRAPEVPIVGQRPQHGQVPGGDDVAL